LSLQHLLLHALPLKEHLPLTSPVLQLVPQLMHAIGMMRTLLRVSVRQLPKFAIPPLIVPMKQDTVLALRLLLVFVPFAQILLTHAQLLQLLT
jgi:hypothetical protein